MGRLAGAKPLYLLTWYPLMANARQRPEDATGNQAIDRWLAEAQRNGRFFDRIGQALNLSDRLKW